MMVEPWSTELSNTAVEQLPPKATGRGLHGAGARCGSDEPDFIDGGSDESVHALLVWGAADHAGLSVAGQLATAADHVNLQVITPNWLTEAVMQQHWRYPASALEPVGPPTGGSAPAMERRKAS